MNPRVRENLLPGSLLIGCLATFFLWLIPRTLVDEGRPSLFTNYDFASYFLPRFWLGSEELLAGRLPVWQRYEFGGLPFLATAQPAVLYPPKILFFGLCGPVAAHVAFLLFHFVLAAASLLWLLREEGAGPTAAFVGTALWIFGNTLLNSIYFPTRIACVAWLPFLVMLSFRIQAGGGLRTFALLALVAALQLLAGYPEVTIDASLLLAVLVTTRWLQNRVGRPPWRAVPLLAGAIALGSVTAALQLLPLAELGVVSRRVTAADQRVREIELLGKPQTPAPPPASSGSGITAEDLLPPGVLVIPGLFAFLPIGFWLRAARPAATGFVFSASMLYGGWLLLRRLPGFAMMRGPLIWLALGLFCAAWLGAVGCHALIDSAGRDTRVRRVGLCFLIIVNVWLIAVWLLSWRAASTPSRAHGAVADFFTHYVGGTGGLALGVIGMSLVSVFAVLKLGGRRLPASLWLAPFATVTMAWLTAYPYESTPAPFAQPFPTGELASMHGRPRDITGRSLAPADLLYGYEITDRLPSALGVEESFLPWRWREIMQYLDFNPLWDRVDWKKILVAHGFWDALDTQFFVAETRLSSLFEARGLAPRKHLADKTLFENPRRMGPAWVNHAVRRVGSAREAFDYVMSARFDPGREVVLEEPTRGSYPAPEGPSVTMPRGGRRFSPTELEVDVDLPRPGVLVVSESAYPGWTAMVDGVPHPWMTADYVLRGVELGPGSHRVRFEYRPASVRWGAVLSAVGFAGIVGLFLLGLRKGSIHS